MKLVLMLSILFSCPSIFASSINHDIKKLRAIIDSERSFKELVGSVKKVKFVKEKGVKSGLVEKDYIEFSTNEGVRATTFFSSEDGAAIGDTLYRISVMRIEPSTMTVTPQGTNDFRNSLSTIEAFLKNTTFEGLTYDLTYEVEFLNTDTLIMRIGLSFDDNIETTCRTAEYKISSKATSIEDSGISSLVFEKIIERKRPGHENCE